MFLELVPAAPEALTNKAVFLAFVPLLTLSIVIFAAILFVFTDVRVAV
jgi:hypothetical protein